MLLPLILLGKPFKTILRVLLILLVAIGVLYVLVVLLGKRQQPGRDGLAADRLDRRPGPPAVKHSSTMPHYVSGMDETQTLALQALRELLDNPDRDKWDKLVAASRTLDKGDRDRSIGAATSGRYYDRPYRGRDSRNCHAEAEAGGGGGAHPGDGPAQHDRGGQAVRVVEGALSNARRYA